MLSVLEESIREGSITIHGIRTIEELSAFAVTKQNGYDHEYRSPRAQAGAHDDLVIALAIASAVAVALPKNIRRAPRQDYDPGISDVCGY